ncbi:MAG: TIM barrel protein [Micrococcales bacterium]|nr:TIM barrel protein [Micrococcales bacterium]
MRTSIATVCLSGTLEAKLRAAAAAGFDGVEIFEPDLVAAPQSPEQIRELAAQLGLSLDLYQPFRDFEGVPQADLENGLRRARAKFELMGRLGIDTMLLCSNVGTATLDDDDLVVEQLRRLGDLAADHGVRVAYEALAWGRYVSTYEHAWRLVRRADHPAIGTCIDSFHILSRGGDPRGIEDIRGDKIFVVQLADAPLLSMDVLSWSRHHRVFPGQGAWDLPAFLAHLMRADYLGPVSLEVFNDTFRQTDVERTALDAMRSLRWLEDRTAALLGANPAPVHLATLPRVEDPTGVDFVEIRGEHLEPVETLLRCLGFTYAGTHRTKDVRLWELDEARIIINETPTDSGRPAVAAIGFIVDDPQRSAARAQALGAPVVARRSQADEAVLQAVRAPDGTEVFFCSSSNAWIAEFAIKDGDPVAAGQTDAADTSVPEAGSRHRVDHVNLDQPWQRQEEGLLFLSAVLSLDPQPSLDVASPLGLVRSQVMRSHDGAVRLALNVAPPMVRRAGSGLGQVQHIAFSCPDLIAFARRARTRGLKFLGVSDNYYDDLSARFDLPADLLGTLRDLDLLYDRDDRGEFLHFYTATVGEVFLEVVQRIDGYDGYGAPNAPVRLAAQHAGRA